MSRVTPITSKTVAITQSAQGDNFSTKTWIALFPLASLTLFVTQPTQAYALSLAAMLGMALVIIAQLAVSGDESAAPFEIKQMIMGLIAPIQFAMMIWAAVYAGRELAGASLLWSSLVAFVVFIGLIVADALASAAVLLISERKNGVSGLAITLLVSNKYAGLLGKII
jgi:hypothetical protein